MGEGSVKMLEGIGGDTFLMRVMNIIDKLIFFIENSILFGIIENTSNFVRVLIYNLS